MNEEIETTMPQASGDEPEIETQAIEESPSEAPAIAAASAEEKGPVAEQPAEDEQPDPLTELRDQVAQLTEETEKFHLRAERREAVIDTMHAELEQLRRGERRSLLRPLVTEVCRTRDDLLRQADTLPADFDRDRAADLLRNFAAALEYTLEDNGVDGFAPEVGEPFDPRQHRVAGKSPTGDPGLVGAIGSVVAPGYRDTEAGTVISAARVVVYVAEESESTRSDPEEELRETPDPAPPKPTA